MKDFPLKENERLDDLQRDGLFVIQNSRHYCFSLDAVLLSDFVKLSPKDCAVELCSGSGVVSILVNAKCHPKSILGVEIDSMLYDMSIRSVELNEIDNISFFNCDLKDAEEYIKEGSIDAIFCNPPYLKPLSDMSKVSQRFVSTKYETTTTIDDILKVTKALLKVGGSLYLIFSTPRLQELLSKAHEKELNLKAIQFVYFKKDTPSALVLCEFIKSENIFSQTLPPIFIND